MEIGETRKPENTLSKTSWVGLGLVRLWVWSLKFGLSIWILDCKYFSLVVIKLQQGIPNSEFRIPNEKAESKLLTRESSKHLVRKENFSSDINLKSEEFEIAKKFREQMKRMKLLRLLSESQRIFEIPNSNSLQTHFIPLHPRWNVTKKMPKTKSS